MGGCFSKKKDNKKDSSLKVKGEKSEDSRDPPPTESPQEEKVKEVLSETSKIIRSTSISNGSVKILEKKEKDPAICCDVDRSEADTASESTTTTTTTTAFREKMAREIEEEEGEIEMKNIRSVSTSRSRSPAKTQKKINRSSFRDAAAKREIRGVDVGCRSARSSPLPVLRARESGNASMRNRPCNSTSSSHNNNNNNYKISSNNNKRDVGERSGRRSVSPAIKRSAVPMMMMDQRQCRSGTSLSATTATATATASASASATTASRVNGRSSPQRGRVPVVDLESSSRGQNGNINAAAAGGNGGTMEAEESLENPLVSLECFIFL